MPRKDFVEVLSEISVKHGFEMQALSHDWIIQIRKPTTGRCCSIFGYTFDINPAGGVELCKEKAATSIVLASRGVPNIPHEVFLNPAQPFTAPYVPKTGNWCKIQAHVQKIGGLPVVVKPLKGTGGFGVFKTSTWSELEAAVQNLFSQEYGIAISPYKKIVDEYRCFMLNGIPKGTYRKVREHIIGDGKSTVLALAQHRLSAASNGEELRALTAAIQQVPSEELEAIPAQGAVVPLQWKHNLGQGATVDLDISNEVKKQVGAIAIEAVEALGMRFCSCDIVKVESESETYAVMEVNSGVMMDSFIGLLGDKGRKFAFEVYEEAVLSSLVEPCSAPGFLAVGHESSRSRSPHRCHK